MYYLNQNGTQSGPMTFEQLRALAQQGRITAADLVWREGDASWQPASAVPGLLALPSTLAAAGNPYQAPGTWQSTPMPEAVPNYLVQAILVTVLCCLPFGIPAIVYAASVSGKLQAGDVVGARVASDKARFWCWMSFWFGIGPAILFTLFSAVGAAGGIVR